MVRILPFNVLHWLLCGYWTIIAFQGLNLIWSFYCNTVEFGLLIFCWGVLHPCSSIILICNFLFCVILVCFFVAIVQSLSCVWVFATPRTATHHVSLSIIISQSLFKFMSIESVMPTNQLVLCHPLLLLPSVFPSTRVFSSGSALCIRWLKYWSFSFSISASNEYWALILFRIDWFDLLTVQGTLKNLFQHHSSKASLLQCSPFLMVQFSDLYMTTEKAIALSRETFVSKVMSLLFNRLSRFVRFSSKEQAS